MSGIIRPLLIALDSSHLGVIADDKFSSDGVRRERAAKFERAFDASGSVLLLSWHHIQELLSHQDEVAAGHRIAAIRSLPLVAVLKSIVDESLPGSVIDLQVCEVKVAFMRPEASVTAVRDEVTKELFRFVSGADSLRPFLESW